MISSTDGDGARLALAPKSAKTGRKTRLYNSVDKRCGLWDYLGMAKQFATAREVLARMRKSELPVMTGASGAFGVFLSDSKRICPQTMLILERSGLINRPVGSSIDAPWTLADNTAHAIQQGE